MCARASCEAAEESDTVRLRLASKLWLPPKVGVSKTAGFLAVGVLTTAAGALEKAVWRGEA
jgi:hypothetical protein